MATSISNSLDYIDSVEYKTLEQKLKDLQKIIDDNQARQSDSRQLRYADIDLEEEREAGRIAPDELYIPQHIIDTNIRNEQPFYVQYVSEPTRAVVCTDLDDLSADLTPLEQDLTRKLRYDGWQLAQFACIDGFQSNGYAVMETVMDQTAPGGVSREFVQMGDFAFINDTRDIQSVEMCSRQYYYTKTKLLRLSDPILNKPEDCWDRNQINKIIEGTQQSGSTPTADNITDSKDRSLHKVQKIMFRVKGVVNVGWACTGVADDWLRKPRPLFLGRRKLVEATNIMSKLMAAARQMTNQLPQSTEDYETQFPYFLYPYLISENDTISQLHGRIFLDQDAQEAITSLLSSTVTQARRAAGMYFSKDVSDPNEDFLLQKNVYFKTGALINGKINAFKIDAPDPGVYSAIQLLVTAKMGETSQVSAATNNRKDSRKTAKESDIAQQKQQALSTVQVVLFSLALASQYSFEVSIIKSRVQAGLLTVAPTVRPLYDRNFKVKAAGDTDVIERQKTIETMMQAWPIVSQTPLAMVFLMDLLEKMFPINAPKYIQALKEAQAQANSAQAQQMQQIMSAVSDMSKGIIQLSKEPEMFSETGKIHAFPIIERTAQVLEELFKQQEKAQNANRNPTGQGPQIS